MAWLESGTMVMGALLRPTLNPAGLHSTNWMVLWVLMFWMALLTSLLTTSPLYRRQQAMYLPCLGSHTTIWLLGSKHALVISFTPWASWPDLAAAMIGE